MNLINSILDPKIIIYLLTQNNIKVNIIRVKKVLLSQTVIEDYDST